MSPRVVPIARKRFAAEFMMDEEMHDDLCRAQALLAHQVSAGDLATVFGRALKALIGQLEKRKFGTAIRPRTLADAADTDADRRVHGGETEGR
jgi:hypothetical protein